MKKQFLFFLLRWIINSFGLWLSLRLLGAFGAQYDEPGATSMFFVAGFVFSLVNTLLRPIIMILSLPAILFTLGLFTLIVNGFLVYISLQLVPGFEVSFWASVFVGVILSLINYVFSGVVELRKEKEY